MTDSLATLPNIGKKLSGMLRECGVNSVDDIERMGPAALYRRMQAFSEKRLPVCYYLYSLEGAVRGIHWDELTDEEKRRLRREAGLKR